MLTVVVSDLHLGTLANADAARSGEPRERLLAALAAADRIVFLGDTLELRERPLAQALEVTRPFFEALAEVAAGKRLTLVPGNHDHALAEPWLARLRLDGTPLRAEHEWGVTTADGAAGRLAALLPRTEVTLAYPGLTLRDDVYATHGHYLDVHLTMPRLEAIAAHAMVRMTGRNGSRPRDAADYEASLSPLYAFYAGLAQGATPAALRRGGSASRSVWRRMNEDDGPLLGRLLLGRVAIPGAVAALNGLGIGPFRPEITAVELRRAGLAAMGTVVDGLGIEAEHVLYGHTHRGGPWPGDDRAEWRSPGGIRLWNSGNWYREPALTDTGPADAGGGTSAHDRAAGALPSPAGSSTVPADAARAPNPYAAGTLIRLRETGEPELESLLEG
jgi:predicted phosphodiesterase